MASKSTALLIAIICILSAPAAMSTGFEVDHVPVTPAEEKALDPVCRLIMIEVPMGHLGVGQGKHAELFNRPEYRMAKNEASLHHRCQSLIARQRYFSATDRMQRGRWLAFFYDNMDFVIRNSQANWPYLAQVCIEKAELHVYEKDYKRALELIEKALSRDPNYAQAYSLYADILSETGNKPQALRQVVEGLKRNPNSKILQRRYTKLGGQLPYPEPYPSAVSQTAIAQQGVTVTSKDANAPTLITETEDKGGTPIITPPLPATPPAPIMSTTATVPAAPPPENPYCRFCP